MGINAYYIYNYIHIIMSRAKLSRITGQTNIDGIIHPFIVTLGNIHISGSWDVSKRDMSDILTYIWEVCNESGFKCDAFLRGEKSLMDEWITHNALYKLHILRTRTQDVDLNHPQRYGWLYKLGAFLLGWIVN